MGKFNPKRQASSDSIGSQRELPGETRTGERERVLGDISIRLEKSGRIEVIFKPKSVVLNPIYSRTPTVFDPWALAESLRSKGSAMVSNVAYAGGTSPIVGMSDGSSYMVTVRRDKKARVYPNTLDSLSGRGNSADPFVSILGEAVEEVMFMDKNDRVVIPQLSQTGLKAYNGHVHRTLSRLSDRLSVERDMPIKNVHADVRMARMNDPSYLHGIPVAIGFAPVVDWERKASIFDIMLQPLQLNRLPIAGFKETIEYETEGRVLERQVVLLKIRSGRDHSPMVMVYHKGEKIGEYRSFERCLAAMGIDPERPFTPNAATIAQHIGVDFGHDSGSYMPTLASLLRSKN